MNRARVEREAGMVVAARQLAADAGARLFSSGGSAIDAAVATAFALCVVDPSNCGVGGYGGFLVYAPASGEPVSIEFNTWVPRGYPAERLRAPGAVAADEMMRGGAGAAPPAVVPGLLAAHELFGRCPRAEVLAPAIGLARDGCPVGEYVAWALEQHRAVASPGRDPAFDALFYPGGVPLAQGAPLVQPDLAATLEAIVERGADALRTGGIATAICETVTAHGGVLAPEDLAGDRTVVGPPAVAHFEDATVYGPSPGGSGTGVLFAALAALDPGRLGANRSANYVEALRAALAAGWAARRASPGSTHPHTTHVTAAGPAGDLVALTFTHGPGFGCDLIAEGTGILLNGGANLFAPGPEEGRVATNMSPLLLVTGEGVAHALGATGGPRIPAMLLSAVVDVVHYGWDLDDAIAAPHVSVLAASGAVEVEAELARRGGPAEGAATMGTGDFGPAGGITRLADEYFGALDRRFEGGLATGEPSRCRS